MRIFLLMGVLATLCGPSPAAAQRPDSGRPAPANGGRERIALSTRPDAASAARPARLACAPLGGEVYDANGKPLAGATLLVKGTHQVFVTDAQGQFLLSSPLYEGQVLVVEAAGFQPTDVPLDDCTLPRLVLARKPDARIKRSGKRAGQVVRLNHRNTNLK